LLNNISKKKKRSQKLSLFDSTLQSTENRPGSLSFTQLRQLEIEQVEEEAPFDAFIPFYNRPPTKSKFKAHYIDPVFVFDKEKEKLAATGGYFKRHAQLKAIEFLHYGITTSLP